MRRWLATLVLANLISLTMRTALAFILIVLSSASHGANITVDRDLQNAPNLTFVLVQGQFEASDGDQFKLKTARLAGNVIVMFKSNGGNLIGALDIGRLIRMKGWTTAVPPEAICASSCALAWLGGARRMVWPTSQVGFHAAHVCVDGQKCEEKGAGNALIGAYLNELGLGYAAVYYITAAAPESMRWLKASEAATLGITLEILGDRTATPTPPAPRPIKPHPVAEPQAPPALPPSKVQSKLKRDPCPIDAWVCRSLRSGKGLN